ncbi:MAG: pentapeptide repeat-containing protein [Erysipelotrichaceae bacterium]|jgi:uncharacterized protein YjbI with pentapeptide repeats/transcriptional regulator with XRE-family HTH domain|nr:pentapeptide repeat-containing protein [Erysipelotrichaceae bacterium]
MLTFEEVGERISVARKLKNLSQTDLANLLSITPQAVGKWERGESMPDIVTFAKMAEVLEVDLNYFADGSMKTTEKPEPTEEAYEEPEEKPYSEPEQESEDPPFFDQPPHHHPGPDFDVPPFSNRSSHFNMSFGSWRNSDFSNLSGLGRMFSASSISNCLFCGSSLKEVKMYGNSMKNNDFSSCDFTGSSLRGNSAANCDFTNCNFSDAKLDGCSFRNDNFDRANCTNTLFKSVSLQNVNLSNCIFNKTAFIHVGFVNIVFEGELKDCRFEDIRRSTRLKFENVTFLNCFFRYCNLRNVTFENCKADKISLAFLRNNGADTSDIEIINETPAEA